MKMVVMMMMTVVIMVMMIFSDDVDDSGDDDDHDFGDVECGDDDDFNENEALRQVHLRRLRDLWTSRLETIISITSAFASIAKNIQANVLEMTQMGDNQSLRPRKLLLNSFNICFFLFLNQKIN